MSSSSSSSLTTELQQLFALHTAGALSADEFVQAKAAVLQRHAAVTTTTTATTTATVTTATTTTAAAGDTASAQQVATSTRAERDTSAPLQHHASPTTGRADVVRHSLPFLLDSNNNNDDDDDVQSEARERYAHVDVRALLADEAATPVAVFDRALQHLERIVRNLLQHPDEAKYRRLRLRHPRLQAELFVVPGSVALLTSIGFRETHDDDDSGSGGGGGAAEPLLVYTPPRDHDERDGAGGSSNNDNSASSSSYATRLLQEALAALSFVHAADVASRHRRDDALRLLQRGSTAAVMLDIRCAEARAAVARDTAATTRTATAAGNDDNNDNDGAQGSDSSGHVDDNDDALRSRRQRAYVAFLTAAYTRDIAGDELRSAARHAAFLVALLERALAALASTTTTTAMTTPQPSQQPQQEQQQNDDEARLCVPLHARAAYAALVAQRGALEALLVFARAQLRRVGGVACVVFCASPHVHTNNNNDDDDDIGDVVTAVRTTAAAMREVCRAVADAQARLQRERRDAAAAVARAQRAREQRAAAQRRELAAATARAQQRRRHASSDSDDSDDDSSGRRARDADGARKRIPVAEALKILLGKARRDDDW